MPSSFGVGVGVGNGNVLDAMASPTGRCSAGNSITNTVTPCLPGDVVAQSGGSNVVVVAAASSAITPYPGKTQKKATNKDQQQPQHKMSKTALAMHQKWQKQAEELGGKGVRIVVKKSEAKKLIFDVLHEAFRPMNITQLHKVTSRTSAKYETSADDRRRRGRLVYNGTYPFVEIFLRSPRSHRRSMPKSPTPYSRRLSTK